MKTALFALILLFSIFARAGNETSSQTEAPPEAEAMPWELKGPSGKISNNTLIYPQRLEGLPTIQDKIDIDGEASYSNLSYGFKVAPWVRAWVPHTQGGETQTTRVFFEAKEAWAEKVDPAWDLRVGNQIITWGAADQINPTDVWNASDLTDPLLSSKLPATVAKLKIHPMSLENLQIELIATPIFRASKLPVAIPDSGSKDIETNSSRWVPLPGSLSAGGVKVPLKYKMNSPDYPATWQAGLRAQLMRMGGWDFSGMMYDGVEKIPRFAIGRKGDSTSADLPITITLNPSYHRTRVFGLDGAGSVNLFDRDFGIRFEAAYTHPDNSRANDAPSDFRDDLIRDDSIMAVAGFDHTLTKKLFGTVMYFNVQYIHSQNLDKHQRNTPGTTVLKGLPNFVPFDRNWMAYVESRIGSTFKLSLATVGSFTNQDGYFSPGAQYQWSDNLKLSANFDLFVGDESGFFGQFADNKRFNLGATYAF